MNKKCWDCGNDATEYDSITRVKKEKIKDLEEDKKYGLCNTAWDYSIYRETIIQRAYCKECYKKHKEQLEDDKRNYIKLKNRLMLERAINILEKQYIDIYDYKEAIDAVKEYHEENPTAFESAHEIVVAIILIDNEVRVKAQYKIGKYRADFYLPEQKIVLEIDGYTHEKQLYEDNKRDNEIREILGKDHEVVRIKTEYIEQTAELVLEAAKTIRDEKQKLRKSNYGMLPEWYSRRERKKAKRNNYGDEFLLG